MSMPAAADGPGAARPGPLPDLPPAIDAEQLRARDDAGLAAALSEIEQAERATVAAMAPYDRQLRELRARRAEIATEQRRRERAARTAARRAVREQAGGEALPALAGALELEPSPLPPDRPLTEVAGFLRSGGEVGFGFATRPGSIAFTDGRQTRQARTWGEARAAHGDGWEPGAPRVPGVRVHLVGTRVERVVPADEVLIRVTEAP